MKDKLKAAGVWCKSLLRNYYFWMLVLLVVAAFALTFFLEFRYFMNDLGRTWQFFFERPLVFWYNAFLVLLMLLFLTGLTRRPVISVGILLSVIIALMYVHVAKFEARGYPLLPEDLLLASEADSMSKMIKVGDLASTIIAVVVSLATSVGLSILIGKAFRLKDLRDKKDPIWKRFAVVPRLVLIVTSVAVFMLATDFVRHNSGQKYEEVPWLDTQLVAWNQVRNYDFNGFILGFLYNLEKFQIEAPEGYSEGAVRSIREKYEQRAEEENAARVSLAEEEMDFIIVLNESFIDPDNIEAYYPHNGGDVTPNLHAIQAEYPSGQMYSLDYGGGTANIEFEILTGLSNYWSQTVPYTALIPKIGKVPSVATYLRSDGYITSGIHPFNGSMYKRDLAFKAFGIDRFITEREMRYDDKEGNSGYINDKSAYRETLDVLAEGGDANQFVTLITMQNHLPYPDWIYGEDAEIPFRVVGDWPEDEGRRKEMGVYYKLLGMSDEYLGNFIAELAERPRKTVVLFFGDHSAGLFPELHDSGDAELLNVSQKTPYFIWTNFDNGVGAVKLPTTTPNCLVNTTFNLLSVQKPPLYYLLDEVCEQTPILTDLYLRDEGYADTEIMRDYELLNYDLVGGEKYWTR